jgi:xanthine dehydrogenase small subunit
MICKRYTGARWAAGQMRDYLLLYINGKQHRVSGEQAFMPLSSYLRYERGATGTKVVCEEGDCGACSIMLGRMVNGEIKYNVVNSCIQFMYQLDCTHIVTIEGLKVNGELNQVQEAMVACHGAQCGFCTPGFVVAMCGMFDNKQPVCQQEIKDGLTGNLCRCTGYEPIIKAGLSVDPAQVVTLHELYPTKPMLDDFGQHARTAVLIKTAEHVFFNPVELTEATKFKAENPGTVIVAGGTDVCVYWNKRGTEPAALMSVSHLPNLQQLEIENETLVVGARTTLTELEQFVKKRIPQLAHILWLFGSPQIRNAGTLAGNIANGSPIADSLPFLYVMEAEVELTGNSGSRRVNINQFYKGYKQLDMKADELITRILIPMPKSDESIRLFKVSKRKHLDISAFTAAFKLRLKDAKVLDASIAYGGVAATIVRMKKTEQFLQGKSFDLHNLEQAGKIAVAEITPISDVRGSSDFRNLLAENIFQKLYYEIETDKEMVCLQ